MSYELKKLDFIRSWLLFIWRMDFPRSCLFSVRICVRLSYRLNFINYGLNVEWHFVKGIASVSWEASC